MPQAKPITLTDAKSTPVQHTFVPSKIGDLTANFVGPGVTLAGREALNIDRREASASVASRAQYVLRLPIEITDNGVSSVSHQSQISVTAIGAPASTAAERADLWAMAEALFANSDARSVFVDSEGLY